MEFIQISYKDSDLKWPVMKAKKRSSLSENLWLPFRYSAFFLNLLIHVIYLYPIRVSCFLLNAGRIYLTGLLHLFGLSLIATVVYWFFEKVGGPVVTHYVGLLLAFKLAAIGVYGAMKKWKDVKELHTFFPGHKAIV